MKATKKDVQNSIMFFAKKFGHEEAYKVLVNTVALPELVRSIETKIFLYQFNFSDCNSEEYSNYMILFEYATELHSIGWVTFEN